MSLHLVLVGKGLTGLLPFADDTMVSINKDTQPNRELVLAPFHLDDGTGAYMTDQNSLAQNHMKVRYLYPAIS